MFKAKKRIQNCIYTETSLLYCNHYSFENELINLFMELLDIIDHFNNSFMKFKTKKHQKEKRKIEVQ